MSDSFSEQAASDTPRAVASGPGGVIRKVILFSVFAVMLFALVYDYAIARPAVRAAYKKITVANVKSNETAQSTFTDEDVAKLLGKQPVTISHEGTDIVEMYTWTSGVPGRPHKLWAVYKPGTDHNGAVNLFYRQCVFVYETSKEVAPIAGKVVGEDMTPEERAEWAAQTVGVDEEYGEEENGSTEIPAESERLGVELRPELEETESGEVSSDDSLEDEPKNEETAE